ncbi:ubiquitin-2 like Rad60 SUMO-like-domain-containing protein [Sphaerosporella brunnea]|uniref:Ubiquitin-2 like Rad60 SUMO-like-domain-containing protein n=1 Tax=Sphaerosporella brunnea TaxID=1250544 RepID=A0A5J5EWQ9_9PEZI|nr:ubiquitin-2 like Rad60 SUMO-like-domain-containing protein [Sphaerosporella brunnea]
MLSSPDLDPPPKKKTGGRPKFNKLQLARKPSTPAAPDEPTPAPSSPPPPRDADNDSLSFFHRSAEAYPVSTGTKRSKKRTFSRDGRGSDSEESESNRTGGRRDRVQRLRQRYQQQDSDDEDDDIPGRLSSTPPRRSTSTKAATTIISLGSSDDEDELYRKPEDPAVTAAAAKQREEERRREEEMLAVLRARVQARAAQAPQESNQPVIYILITSDIANTKPLMVKRRYDQPIKDVRLVWCEAQKFTPAQTNEVFLVWKNRIKLADRVSCKGIGVALDPSGEPNGDGVIAGKVHFQAMTQELFERAISGPREEEEELPEEKKKEEPEEGLIRLVLKSKGKDEYKLRVRPTTTIASMIEAYRKAKNVGPAQVVRLDFEGDTLDPDDTVGDTDLEDMVMIDVYVT